MWFSRCAQASLSVAAMAPRVCPLQPQHWIASSIPLDTEEAHESVCDGRGCTRCQFWNCFHGRLRPGSKELHAPDSAFAWRHRFAFQHPSLNTMVTWLCVRPILAGGPWAFGCWLCNKVTTRGTKFARVEATCVRSATLGNHAGSKENLAALQHLLEQEKADAAPIISEPLALSGGVAEGVPRLDRWLQAASVLERYDSFADLGRSVSTASVGSMLHQGDCVTDSSRKVASQLLQCLVEPLHWRDMEVMSNATSSSIACDERATVLLVSARVYIRRTQELYDFVAGIARGYGTSPQNCKQALEAILRKCCTLRHGKQTGENPDATFAQGVFDRFRKSVRSVVADGGPTEQRALFESSPAAKDEINQRDILFPGLVDINRDRAHKWRSVQKGIWAGIDAPLQDFLHDLVTGEGSLARMLQTSSKVQKLFKDFRGHVCASAQPACCSRCRHTSVCTPHDVCPRCMH